VKGNIAWLIENCAINVTKDAKAFRHIHKITESQKKRCEYGI
jgi:hypothetical protein